MPLEEFRTQHFRQHPLDEALDEALRTTRNPTPMFFFGRVADRDMRDIRVSLARLGEELERSFAIHGEISIFFAPWTDFQRRSFNAISQNALELCRASQMRHLNEVRFTPSNRVSLVVANDTNIRSKVEEWSKTTDGATVVAAISSEQLRQESPAKIKQDLISELRRALGRRDLYRAQNPVIGADFFGRDQLIADIGACMTNGENVAILGLRRSGKTSVLNELSRTLAPKSVLVSIVDMNSARTSSPVELGRSVLQQTAETIRTAKEKGLKATTGLQGSTLDSLSSVAGFSDLLRRIADRNKHLHFVAALDEVEHLFAHARSDPIAVQSFLGALRSAAQNCPNFSLAFSGVANSAFHSSSLGTEEIAVDNPMFDQVTSFYLGPFELDDSAHLLRGLGDPMFVSWSDGAVDAAHQITGGVPFFLRDLASTILNDQKVDAGSDLAIDESAVSRIEASWRQRAAKSWSQIVESLRLHYPDAAYLLSPDVDEEALDDWITGSLEIQSAANCLVELELLEVREGSYGFSQQLSALRALDGGNLAASFAPKEEASLRELMQLPEGHHLEFKSSVRVDLGTGKKERYIEHAILKTVAGFLNADGGTLLIGLDDAGKQVGLDPDLTTWAHNSFDDLERYVIKDLLGRSLGQSIVTNHVSFATSQLRGRPVISLSVSRAPDICLCDSSDLFVRSGNQTLKLEGAELVRFVQERR